MCEFLFLRRREALPTCLRTDNDALELGRRQLHEPTKPLQTTLVRCCFCAKPQIGSYHGVQSFRKAECHRGLQDYKNAKAHLELVICVLCRRAHFCLQNLESV